MGPVAPANQIHDFNPGFDNGLFWTVRIPDKSVDVNPQAGKAHLVVDDLEIEDYFNLDNALKDGPSVDAEVSFDCRWSGPIARTSYRNVAEQFTGLFTQTQAQVQWSGTNENGFEFRTTATTTVIRAETGEERNGVFFS